MTDSRARGDKSRDIKQAHARQRDRQAVVLPAHISVLPASYSLLLSVALISSRNDRPAICAVVLGHRASLLRRPRFPQDQPRQARRLRAEAAWPVRSAADRPARAFRPHADTRQRLDNGRVSTPSTRTQGTALTRVGIVQDTRGLLPRRRHNKELQHHRGLQERRSTSVHRARRPNGQYSLPIAAQRRH